MGIAFVLGEVLAMIELPLFATTIICLCFFVTGVAAWVLPPQLQKKSKENKEAYKVIIKAGVVFIMAFFIGIAAFYNMKDELRQLEQTKDADFESLVSSQNNVTVTGRYCYFTENEYSYYCYLEDVTVGSVGYKFDRILVVMDESPEFEPGNIISVSGELEEFSVARNTGNFDSRKYYKSISIYCKIELESSEVVSTKKDFIRCKLQKLRQNLKAVISECCSKEDAGVYDAMVLGDKSSLEEDTKNLFQAAGIMHILSISGMHISILGMGLYSLLRKRSRFVVSSCISLSFMVAFGIMTCGGISTIRAVVMFALRLLAEIVGRSYDAISSLIVAAIVVSFKYPFAFTGFTFWMSFGAAAVCVIIYPAVLKYLKISGKTLSGINVSICINMILNPAIAWTYFELPVYSPVINLMIMPILGVILVSGVVAALLGTKFIGASKIILKFGCIGIHFIRWVCNKFSQLPGGLIICGKPSVRKICIYYAFSGLYVIIVFIALKIRRKRMFKTKEFIVYADSLKIKILKHGVHICVYMLLLGILMFKNNKDLSISIIDVGQGDGIYINTPDNLSITIDGGSTDINNVAKYRMVPFLKAGGVGKIDYAFITHVDEDHTSGILDMIENQDTYGIKVLNLVMTDIENYDETYLEVVETAKENGVKVLYMGSGDSIKSQNYKITCLHPDYTYQSDSRNDYSFIFDLQYGGFSALFTGDFGGDEEKIIKEIHKDYTLLKVAHHGSKYSTSSEFLEKVNPVFSTISCGINNLYGHPAEELLDRLNQTDTKTYVTTECGEITFVTDGSKLKIRCFLN